MVAPCPRRRGERRAAEDRVRAVAGSGKANPCCYPAKDTGNDAGHLVVSSRRARLAADASWRASCWCWALKGARTKGCARRATQSTPCGALRQRTTCWRGAERNGEKQRQKGGRLESNSRYQQREGSVRGGRDKHVVAVALVGVSRAGRFVICRQGSWWAVRACQTGDIQKMPNVTLPVKGCSTTSRVRLHAL